MKRRKWEAKTNAAVVLPGLKGKSVAAFRLELQISQAQYDQWRDQFLTHAGQAFEVHQQSQRETRLQQESTRLKQKVLVEPEGWLYIILVLDWYTKKIVGWQAGTRSTAQDWIHAVGQRLQQQLPNGVKEQGLYLMSDNGYQPTGKTFTKICTALGITQAFTSYNNPKSHADTERLMRTLKEELIWLREWSSYQKLQEALAQWVTYYNEHSHHSTLGYKTPTQFEQKYQASHRTKFVTT